MQPNLPLFVYGTLHPDQAPAEIAEFVSKFKLIGEGTIRGRLKQLAEYPAVTLNTRPASEVKGNVFEIPGDPEIMEKLDHYEDFHPNEPAKSLFIRTKTRVKLASGGTVQCWIYVYNRSLAA